jgi:hypothetical protein
MSIGFGLLAALESKSAKAGIRYAIWVFISITLIFIFLHLTIPALRNLNIDSDVYFPVLTVAAWVYSVISIRNYWHILRYGGQLTTANKSILKEEAISIISVIGFIFFTLFIFLRAPNMPVDLVAYLLAFSGASLSSYIYRFQVRENGVTYRGKLFLFNDIQAMYWEPQVYKEKVKIILRSGKIITTKIPWELTLPVDDYVKSINPQHNSDKILDISGD